VMLSDTVGFISDLPTMLVASFRATLEDVVEADVLLHVRDISHVETEAEAKDVEEVLRQLGINPDDRTRLIEVWNKADLLAEDERERLAHRVERIDAALRPSLISAVSGEGIDALLQGIEERIARNRRTFHILLPAQDGGGLHWLYEEAEIISRDETESGAIDLTIRIAPEKEPRLINRFPEAEKLA
jgi:GTP-binding protein HflX